jgi:hypothetical protein
MEVKRDLKSRVSDAMVEFSIADLLFRALIWLLVTAFL